ncbi:hypothetical protein FOHLNKBM_4522 [Methylobacterium longum]|nr:hypothetical protein FOHLNKBM_4522 [Methylobacterium longum]
MSPSSVSGAISSQSALCSGPPRPAAREGVKAVSVTCPPEAGLPSWRTELRPSSQGPGLPSGSPIAFRRNRMRQRGLRGSGRPWILWQRWQKAAGLASGSFEVSWSRGAAAGPTRVCRTRLGMPVPIPRSIRLPHPSRRRSTAAFHQRPSPKVVDHPPVRPSAARAAAFGSAAPDHGRALRPVDGKRRWSGRIGRVAAACRRWWKKRSGGAPVRLEQGRLPVAGAQP